MEEILVDDLPDDAIGDAKVVFGEDAVADDGSSVTMNDTEFATLDEAGEVDDPDAPNDVEEGQDGDETEREKTGGWDKERQKVQQENANLRKRIAEIEGKASPAENAEGDEGDEKPPEEAPDTDISYDTLFKRAETPKTEKIPKLPELPEDPEYDDLIAYNKALAVRQAALEERVERRESEDGLRQIYSDQLRSHNLPTDQTASLHKQVQAEFQKRGYSEGNLPSNEQLGDIVGRIAAEMQNAELRKSPDRRSRPKPTPTAPKAKVRGQAARPVTARGRLMTVDEALREIDAIPRK